MTALRTDQHNANKGTKRGRELLEQSLKELGAGRSILVDKDGNVIAGNKTLEMAQKLGLKVRIIEAGRDELVAVQRPDLDLTDGAGEARRLAYLDNRVAELDLEWDAQVIVADMQAGMDLDALGFLEKELQGLVIGTEESSGKNAPDAEMERAAELKAKWGVEPGQIWQLGEHRLACADCTDWGTVERFLTGERMQVCWTDPPWNVNYGAVDKENVQGYKVRTIANDNLGDKFPEFVQVVPGDGGAGVAGGGRFPALEGVPLVEHCHLGKGSVGAFQEGLSHTVRAALVWLEGRRGPDPGGDGPQAVGRVADRAAQEVGRVPDYETGGAGGAVAGKLQPAGGSGLRSVRGERDDHRGVRADGQALPGDGCGPGAGGGEPGAVGGDDGDATSPPVAYGDIPPF
jgi:hypothetical protein